MCRAAFSYMILPPLASQTKQQNIKVASGSLRSDMLETKAVQMCEGTLLLLLFLLHADHSGKGYGSVREEAVKLFNCLQQLESAREPVPIIQGVLQTCLDLRPLRDEVYCQLVKQTSYTPSPHTAAHLRYWQLLTCMSCTFLPGPSVLKYLRFHLKR